MWIYNYRLFIYFLKFVVVNHIAICSNRLNGRVGRVEDIVLGFPFVGYDSLVKSKLRFWHELHTP